MDRSEKIQFIPQALYDRIAKCLPIVSVEAVIKIGDDLLFLKRKNQPAKGEWWFPGGRIHKEETLEEALYREVKEETGLEVINYKLINVYSRVFPERHDITIAYLCICRGNISLNNEHSEYKLSKTKNRPKLHPYLLKTIMDIKL